MEGPLPARLRLARKAGQYAGANLNLSRAEWLQKRDRRKTGRAIVALQCCPGATRIVFKGESIVRSHDTRRNDRALCIALRQTCSKVKLQVCFVEFVAKSRNTLYV